MCSKVRLIVAKSNALLSTGHFSLRFVLIKVTLSEEILYRAKLSIPSEKSNPTNLSALVISHSVFFPVPQPNSKTLEKFILNKDSLVASLSRSRVGLMLLS